MKYSELVAVYDSLSGTTRKLEKASLLAVFLKKIQKEGKSEWVYLLQGKVVPDYDSRETGISTQLIMKAFVKSYGYSSEAVIRKFNEVGDLGEMAEKFSMKKKQNSLFSKILSVEHVFSSFKKIMTIEGKGSVDIKLNLVSELLLSASPREARYIVRTLLQDLRVGVADALLRNAIVEAFFAEEERKEMGEKIEEAINLVNDIALVFDYAKKGKNAFSKLHLVPGRPMKVMLPVKVTSIQEAFDVCGRPAAFEHKYDGFRVLISKEKGKVSLFTRKLENVTAQFPDVVKAVLENVSGESFVLDSEVVGYNPKTKKYMPFESISQRIRRKYDIEKLIKILPVEINVFDAVYHNGKELIHEPFFERRKIVEKIIKRKDWVIKASEQIVTDSDKVAEKFYETALKNGEEGIMIKKIDADYMFGRRVGYIAKLKPIIADLDLVITGAEYGTGKRAGWLTSFIVACKDREYFKDIGKVSSGLKEKEEEGTTYEFVTKLLKPLMQGTKDNYVSVRPEIVVAVTYQNIQKSSEYSSGYALRFPRIAAYRPDKSPDEISSIEDIEKEVKKQR